MTSSKAQLGQFFTTSPDVQRVMTSLVSKKKGLALEPSAGAGHLSIALSVAKPGLVVDSVEFDSSIPWTHQNLPITYDDFFAYAAGKDSSFDVVFGNPPYVAWKEIGPSTRALLEDAFTEYSGKTNLYHLFIHRSIDLLKDGGELVFIVPGEWCYSTSASPLRKVMQDKGALTHVVDCGEEKLFADADVPSIMIFRFVKAAKQGTVAYWGTFGAARDKTAAQSRVLQVTNERWLFLDTKIGKQIANWTRLGALYDVKVGLVTGSDKVYKVTDPSKFETSCVIEQVTTNRKLEHFLYLEDFQTESAIPPLTSAYLKPHKAHLLARRIRSFTSSNWWRYGAVRNITHMKSDKPRFFANSKTREAHPFFAVTGAKYYTGGVLGVYRNSDHDITDEKAMELLNSPKYRQIFDSMMITSGGKISLQPATLEDAPFPSTLEELELFLTTP